MTKIHKFRRKFNTDYVVELLKKFESLKDMPQWELKLDEEYLKAWTMPKEILGEGFHAPAIGMVGILGKSRFSFSSSTLIISNQIIFQSTISM